MAAPFASLAYLYVGSADVAKDLDYYQRVLGATLVWDFEDFGTRVAAVRVGPAPIVILAGHRPAPSVLPVFAVDNLEASARSWREGGWRENAGPFGLPDGPCYLFEDPSGTEIAAFEPLRPNVLEGEYARSERRGTG
jgi:hypothetical protein